VECKKAPHKRKKILAHQYPLQNLCFQSKAAIRDSIKPLEGKKMKGSRCKRGGGVIGKVI